MAKQHATGGEIITSYTNHFIQSKDEWLSEIIENFKELSDTKHLAKDILKREELHPVMTTWLLAVGLLPLKNVFTKKVYEYLNEFIQMNIAMQLDIEYVGLSENVDNYQEWFRSHESMYAGWMSDWLLNELLDNPPDSVMLRVNMDSLATSYGTSYHWKQISEDFKIDIRDN